MVKLRSRVLTQYYKRSQKPYQYDQFSLDFPFKFNDKIRPHIAKNFEIIVTVEDNPKQETVNISLIRKKNAQDPGNNHKLF